MGLGRWRRFLGRDLRGAAVDVGGELHTEPTSVGEIVTELDLAELPEPAQRYLRFMDVVGRPRDTGLLAHFTGRFRRSRDDAWMRCEAWQRDSARPVTRTFVMRIDFAGVIPMVGHDTYALGHGRMHGKLFDMFTVADGAGPELDLSELTTYVNDALMLAPSMLLVPAVTWSPVDDDNAFAVTLHDAGMTSTTRVLVGDDGAMDDTETWDRYCALPDGPVRARWTTPIDGWAAFDGRPLPTGGRAIWDLEDGPFCYAEGAFTPGSVEYELS